MCVSYSKRGKTKNNALDQNYRNCAEVPAGSTSRASLIASDVAIS